MYCVDVPLHAASGLFMFTLPPKRGTTRKQKLIKKAEYNDGSGDSSYHFGLQTKQKSDPLVTLELALM